MREVKTNLHGQSLTSTHPSPSSNRSFGQRQPGAHWSPHGSGFPRFSQVSGHSVPHDEKTFPFVQVVDGGGVVGAVVFITDVIEIDLVHKNNTDDHLSSNVGKSA